jgi:hypothetical protein
MTNQRDANQTRDTRLASALMRRAPHGQKYRFNTVDRRPPSTARTVGVEAGFGSARDAEMSGVHEAMSGGKPGKNWAEFNPGSVWNGHPTKANYSNSSWIDIRKIALRDSDLIEQTFEQETQQNADSPVVPDNAHHRHGSMVHENAVTLRTGGAAARNSPRLPGEGRHGWGSKQTYNVKGNAERHDERDESPQGCQSCGGHSPNASKPKSAGMLGLFTIPFRAGKALHKAAFGTARDLSRIPSCHPDSYALHVGNTPNVTAGRENIANLQAIEAAYVLAAADEAMVRHTPSGNDTMAAMNARRAQAHSATRGAMGSAHGARAVSSNVYGVGRRAGINPQTMA